MAQTALCQTVPTDCELATRSQAGQHKAFETLIARHQDAVYGLARCLLDNEEDALDAAQEAIVRAYESLGRYDSRRPFGPWLRGIAVHVCRDVRRRLRRRRVQAVDLSREGVAEAAASVPSRSTGPPKEPTAGWPRPERGANGTELLQETVRDILRLIPDNYRAPLVLFYLQEASVKEIADTLGLRAGTVRVRLHRAREMMRHHLIGRLPGARAAGTGRNARPTPQSMSPPPRGEVTTKEPSAVQRGGAAAKREGGV